MNLIEGIEVAYFRSIYKERLDELSGLTIFFGRNDSGKSNFLRALNLFFEGQTNPGLAFNFDRDFNHARLEDASASAGARKFSYIKVHFKSPANWKNSLGERFWVKKQWSVNKQVTPGFETSVALNKQHYLTRFLNNVKFHYIPAIKDRTIFERLLSKLYTVLSSQKEFNDSLNSFSAELKIKTDELSQGLLGSIGVSSIIAPPTDLTDLFKSLDFETIGESGDAYSLTLQRGDGVQVRHIPEILAFLSDRGPEDFHIWGFEEPENSLELASAIEEAARFLKLSTSGNKQIFVTSHSPAFFRTVGGGVKRYFVTKAITEGLTKSSSIVQEMTGLDAASLPADLMGETPHLAIISSYLDEAAVKIGLLQDQAKELVDKANEAVAPILFVEGETDARLVRAAWLAFAEEGSPLRVESCEGTSRMESLAADGAVLKMLAPGRAMHVLVDNDGEARALRKDGKLRPVGGRWVLHNSNKAWWCRLELGSEFVDEMTALGIPEFYWPGTIENIFPKATRMRAIADGVYELSGSPFPDLLNSATYPKISARLSGAVEDRLYVVAPTVSTKEAFTEWLVTTAQEEPQVLDPLRTIIVGLAELLNPQKA